MRGPSERTVSWAVVGAGRFATERMVPAIASVPGSRIDGVWARDHDAARHLAATVGATTYPDLDTLLSSRADIAYVAATPAAHPSLVEALLTAGIPVLCEKPLALTASAARAASPSCRAHSASPASSITTCGPTTA